MGGCIHVWRPKHLLLLSPPHFFYTQSLTNPRTYHFSWAQGPASPDTHSSLHPCSAYCWAADVHPWHQGFHTRAGNPQQLLRRLAVSPPQMAGSDYKDHGLNQLSLGNSRAAVEGRLQFPTGEQSLTRELQGCSLLCRVQHKLACTCLHANL